MLALGCQGVQQACRSGAVYAKIRLGFQGFRQAREVEDPVQAGRQGRRIGKAARHESDGDARQEFEIPGIANEGIDLVAGGRQRLGQVASDEPGPSGQ